jgi:hypothetical protein
VDNELAALKAELATGAPAAELPAGDEEPADAEIVDRPADAAPNGSAPAAETAPTGGEA